LKKEKEIDFEFLTISGRECRHPYLDENLVRFAMSVSLRCLVSFEGELCGKTVLREELKRLGFSQQCFECPKVFC